MPNMAAANDRVAVGSGSPEPHMDGAAPQLYYESVVQLRETPLRPRNEANRTHTPRLVQVFRGPRCWPYVSLAPKRSASSVSLAMYAGQS